MRLSVFGRHSDDMLLRDRDIMLIGEQKEQRVSNDYNRHRSAGVDREKANLHVNTRQSPVQCRIRQRGKKPVLLENDRPGKQFNLVIDEESLDNACHVWSHIILLKYGCGQALKTRIRPSWRCRQMRDSSVKTTSFHSAAHILLSSHQWWQRRLWFCV
ncbi:hypothetical protein TNCV_1046201 [Trichonephila clavipes]|nr:hypothetical protein TNCV_1046201 [Trichonephila clavipes]